MTFLICFLKDYFRFSTLYFMIQIVYTRFSNIRLLHTDTDTDTGPLCSLTGKFPAEIISVMANFHFISHTFCCLDVIGKFCFYVVFASNMSHSLASIVERRKYLLTPVRDHRQI